jgi:hypothetical protein
VLLRCLIIRNCKSLRLFKVDIAAALSLKHNRAQPTQLQALPYNGYCIAEPCCDGRYVDTAINEITERFELICRVHGDTHDVLSKTDLTSIGFGGYQLVRDVRIGSDGTLLHR